MDEGQLVTFIIVNYKTPELIRVCYESLRKHFPLQPAILIDNGSEDESTDYIATQWERKRTSILLNSVNLGHGPAMHQGALLCQTPYVFYLDSDCEVRDGWFLGELLKEFHIPPVYAVGESGYVNWNGVTAKGATARQGFHPYVYPARLLIDVAKYFMLSPFIHAGAPAIENMRSAVRKKYVLMDVQLDEYIWHKGEGTRKQFDKPNWNPGP